ncbi:MAG TPA: ribosomal L7Ae/L30e/S12e/Gadd45 family protein [Alloiococcus sp.]|nr:ribosomal L7Ae/L30e/S12e/Gadd45 family protein [Alloiococcus sp.]
MDNKQKALNLLGLAQRAGKLMTGESMVLDAIKQNKAIIVIVASDSSKRSIKQFKNKSQTYNVKINLDYTSEEISQAIGKERKNCAIIDNGFAESFIQLH